MDTVQAVQEPEEIPSNISVVSEKVSSSYRIQALTKFMLFIGWLMILADGVGMVMVALDYHANLGVYMVIFGLLGGVTLIGGAFFLQGKIADKKSMPSDG